MLQKAGGTNSSRYNIRVQASGRYLYVNQSENGVIYTATASAEDLAADKFIFKLEPSTGPGSGGGFQGQCFAVATPGFNPSYDTTAVSGVLDWPCRNNEECSLNGVCSSGACQCRPAWKGKRCELLNLQAPTRGAGYRGTDGGHNTSSWGGAVLKGSDGLYHMWAAEMTEHCGIGTWNQNSRVIHATSKTAGGAYTRKDVTWEVFSHEPEVIAGPDGEYIMYFTADLRSEHGLCNCCRPGHGPCDGSTGQGDCGNSFNSSSSKGALKKHSSSDSYMSFTKDPNGKWTTPTKIFADYTGGDTNFAPYVAIHILYCHAFMHSCNVSRAAPAFGAVCTMQLPTWIEE